MNKTDSCLFDCDLYTLTNIQKNLNKIKSEKIYSSEIIVINHSPSDPQAGNNNSGTKAGNNSTILDFVTNLDIYKKLEYMEKKIMKRLHDLETFKGKSIIEADFSLLPCLPLADLSSLLDIEEMLKDENVAKQLFNRFLQVSGRNGTDFIRRCLATLFNNRVATACSWTGKKNNFRLKECIVMKCLRDAVQQVFPTTDKELELVIMEWFRHAKQRLKREEDINLVQT